MLRLGIAGLGEASTEFLPAYSRSPLVQLVACADSRDIARRRFESDFGGRAYETIEELCDQKDIDVVVVATNHEFHVEPTLMAAQAGKHVIVEKPMALTLEDCDKMISACESNGVLLVGGHNHSYDPPIKKMREVIKSGRIGALKMVNSWVYNDFMVRPYPDSHLEQSRGVVLNQGSHHIDVLRLLGGGLLKSVRGTAGQWDPERPGEGAYVAYFEFEDGAAASLVYNGYGFFDTAEFLGWVGESGQPRVPGVNHAARMNYIRYLEMSPNDRADLMNDLKEKMRYGSLAVGERAQMPPGWEKGGRPSFGDLPTYQPTFGFTIVSCERGDITQTRDSIRIHGDQIEELGLEGITGGREAEIEEMYKGIYEDKPPAHDGYWGKASVEACLALLESSSERREVELKHQVQLRD